MMNAPAATPQMLPMPPRTTIARAVNDTVNPNWSGVTMTSFDGEEHAGEAGGRCADRERQQLGRDGVDAHARGRQLVLADRDPRATEARILEPVEQA